MATDPNTLDLLDYVHASPSPRHCVAETVRRLDAAGFEEIAEEDAWSLNFGDARYLIRGGTVLAFRVGSVPAVEGGFRLIGAHTDSPNLRIKPVPDVRAQGYQQLGIETYGGLLDYTWLDRDLGLAGGVVVRDGGALTTRLVRIDTPILRIPSLAIHLNREVREKGLKLNAQTHLQPVLGLSKGADEVSALKALLAEQLSVEVDQIVSWDLSVMDVVAPTVGGLNGEFIFCPRMDNQAMCHSALIALLDASQAKATQVICLYDHEEVGSGSAAGAAGNSVEALLRRITETEGPGAVPGGLPRAIARSLQVSADMAHAVHPNYADRHEPKHMPHLNAGPVIKVNTQQRYATDAETAGLFEALCDEAGVPCQTFVNRTDLRCGSTIGPISAARLGVRTVDVGNPMLSMHAIREMGGSEDPPHMTAVMTRFLMHA
ncbi:MAG: M18 family aminopeptidase [Myxococcota bacterium]